MLKIVLIVVLAIICGVLLIFPPQPSLAGPDSLDQRLNTRLAALGFTGSIESTLEQRLGRRLDSQRANLGRLLWFDTIAGLNNDNTFAGFHSPTNGFGHTQSIAI